MSPWLRKQFFVSYLLKLIILFLKSEQDCKKKSQNTTQLLYKLMRWFSKILYVLILFSNIQAKWLIQRKIYTVFKFIFSQIVVIINKTKLQSSLALFHPEVDVWLTARHFCSVSVSDHNPWGLTEQRPDYTCWAVALAIFVYTLDWSALSVITNLFSSLMMFNAIRCLFISM